MRLAVLFDHFGPYHRARLRAARRCGEVLGVEFRGRSRDYAWEVSEKGDLPLRTIEESPSSASPAKLSRAEFSQRLGAVLETFRPEALAVPGWASWEALSALAWALRRGVPAILMSESTAHDEHRVGWKEWVKGRVVRLFSSALVGGSAHADYLAQLGMPAEKIFLGYDAVDNAHFTAPAAPRRSGFLASARFIEKKNLPGLIRAYAQYRDAAQGEPWPLTLLGDGPLRPRLEALVAELGLRDRVTLPGFRQYQELPGYYASAGAFIHASTTEQWGLVVNEAMASGLPVLVSDRCGCAPDLVREGGNGFTFDPWDVSAMARAMAAVAGLSQGQRESMGGESERIIAEWGPERFGRGLWEAAEVALTTGPAAARAGDKLLLKLLSKR